MLAQFMYDIYYQFYEKKNSKFFQNFLNFFSVFWTTLTNKKIFLHFWAKNNKILYTRRATCPFDPPKMFCRGLNYKLSSKRPPPANTLIFRSLCRVGLIKIFLFKIYQILDEMNSYRLENYEFVLEGSPVESFLVFYFSIIDDCKDSCSLLVSSLYCHDS